MCEGLPARQPGTGKVCIKADDPVASIALREPCLRERTAVDDAVVTRGKVSVAAACKNNKVYVVELITLR